MPLFFGIAPGEEKTATGLRIRVSDDGETVWMHGKWLDLGPDHAVAWIDGPATFRRPDGKVKQLGEFPAWVCASKEKKNRVVAAMLDIAQFRGGVITIGKREYLIPSR